MEAMGATTQNSRDGGRAKLIIVNGSLMLAGIFNLGWGCYKAVVGDQPLAITCLTAGLLLLLASTIDRFELLKGFGIEAKTRALQQVLSEAGVTLEQLQHLAEITSRSIVSLTSGAGRVGGAPTIRSSLGTVNEVRDTLLKLNTDPAKIRAILQPWVRITIFDAAMHITKSIRNELVAVQQSANAQAAQYPEPRSLADEATYAALVQRALAASEFNLDRLGNQGEWPLETFSSRLGQIITDMPVRDEATRTTLRNLVEEWDPRLAYLIEHQALLDPEAWFAIPR